MCASSKKRHPRLEAGFFSDTFFYWLVPLFFYGKNHNIETKDLYDVLPENRSEELGNRLEKLWSNELINARKNNKKPSLLKCIIIDFGWSFSIYAIHIGVSMLGARIVSPLALGCLISYFTGKTNNKADAYLHASILVGCMLLSAILNKTHFRGMQNLGMNIKIACSSIIFRKMMRLSHTSLNKISGEKVINLLSNDVVKFEKALAYLHFTWCIPLQVLLIGYIMWLKIGIAALAGVFSIVFLSMPMQVFCARIMEKLRRKVGGRTERRVTLIGEIINGINVIKMYGWEKPFEKIISKARKHEIDAIASIFYIKGLLSSLFAYAQRLSLFVAILVYVIQGNEMSAAAIYTYVQLLGFLHFSINFLFFREVTLGSQAIASIRRIQEFLEMEEFRNEITFGSLNQEKNLIIKVENLSASWTGNPNVPCLTDVNLSLIIGKLYAVTGLVGSGKSSFLKSLVAEIAPLKGRISMIGDISYCTQDPWLLPDSIKNNILFGAQYSKERYTRVVQACALMEDFLQLPNGDKTIVGENGTTLSGGQCSRINLARAVYRDTDIYLLDDPFSAVDLRISNHILESCLKDFLKGKTVIFVTHKVQCMKSADEVILIDQGRVKFKGSYEILKENAVYQYLISHDKVDTTLENEEANYFSEINFSSRKDEINDETEALLNNKTNLGETIIPKNTERELKPTHNKKIPMHLCWIYLRFGSPRYVILIATAIFALAQGLCNGCDYWLAYWVTSEETYLRGLQNNASSEYIDLQIGLTVFGGFVVGIIFTSIIRAVLLYQICINANKTIHDKMVNSLVETFLCFFHFNDSGRILNRFTSDMGQVDEVLPETIFHALETLLHVIGLIIQSVLIEWKTGILFFFMIYLTMKLRLFTLKTIRALKKLESKAKSPIFSHVKSSFAGIATIRSFKAQSMVCQQFDFHQNNHTAAFYIKDIGLLAYGLWANLIYVRFVSAIPYIFLAFDDNELSGANAGLIITQVLFMVGVIQYGLTLLSEVSMHMITVQRTLQYTQLEKETSIGLKTLANWPSEGRIKFDNLDLTYPGTDQPVLKNICISIEPGIKVGIVGRTGAGKSSLISALLRLTHISGTLQIDGVETKNIDLHDLRQKISVLPQSPILFSISLRENLDPFKKFDDASLWKILRHVELEKIFNSLDQQLDRNNLSTGQRQLLCLARAILKKNKIFILDEATANVDDVTDSLIQKTIRRKLKDCTVLTIAHRLNTVVDSDRILVMDQGKVIEFDHPHILFQQENGFFSKMVQSTGDVIARHLKKLAAEAFKKQKPNVFEKNLVKN